MSETANTPSAFADFAVGNVDEAYNKARVDVRTGALIRGGWPALPDLIPVDLTILTDRLDAEAAENTAVTLSETCQGWLRRRSGRFCVRKPGPGVVSDRQDDRDLALQGEWTLTNDESAALVFTGKGGWLFTTFCNRVPTNGKGNALAQDVEIVAGADAASLLYRVYWGADAGDPTALHRICWRFRGFK